MGPRYTEAQGERWQEVAPAGFTPPITPALETISPPPLSERLLTALQETVHASPIGTTPAGQAIIDHELSRSLATIQARLTRLTRGYAIAAGPERGQYVQFVRALQSTKPMGLTFQALLTAGSVENLSLLHEDQVLLGLAQADIAREAQAGQGPFASQGPFPELRALGSLYPELLHIVVRADSSAKTVRDLMHKRISLGPAGSGSRATAERVLGAYGMEGGRDFVQDESTLVSSMTALEAGSVDAVDPGDRHPSRRDQKRRRGGAAAVAADRCGDACEIDRGGRRVAARRDRKGNLSWRHPGRRHGGGGGAARDDLVAQRGGGGHAGQSHLWQQGRSSGGR